MDELKRLIGESIHGYVEVDQVYARYQDSMGDIDDSGEGSVITPSQMSHGPNGKPGIMFDHPRGGEALYLSGQLTDKGPQIAQKLANALGDRPLVDVVIEAVQDIAGGVGDRAPREYWILRASAHPFVRQRGRIVFDLPALMPRMSQAELDAIRDAAGGDLLRHFAGAEDGGEAQHSTSSGGATAFLRRGISSGRSAR